MERLFIYIFQMSISTSYLILAVLFVRFLLRKAPKGMRSFLWLLVGIRLIMPFSVESVFSLIPNTQMTDTYFYNTEQEKIYWNTDTVRPQKSDSQPILDAYMPTQEGHMSRTQMFIQIGTKVWIGGMILMFGYLIISWLQLKRRVKMAIPINFLLDLNVYQKIYRSHMIESPFLFGIVKPRIYIPEDIADEELPYVVSHEMAHLKRKDYLIKPIGFTLLSIYWFNPFVWIAYMMLCKDIELICDEMVIKKLGASCKKAYSQALLNSATNRRIIAACPIAFGEVSVKERVKNVLNYKKPAFWVLVAAALACVVVPVCFMTQKKVDSSENTVQEEALLEEELLEEVPVTDYNLDDMIAGSYEMLNPDPDKYMDFPCLTLQKNKQFSFVYDPLSSSLCIGEYELKEDKLYLTTDNGEQYQFTYIANGNLLLFDAEKSSDVSKIDAEKNPAAPIENGSIFFRNSVSAVLNDAKRISQSLNDTDTTMTVEMLKEQQSTLSEMQIQLTMGAMKSQWQLEKIKELQQISQEQMTALEEKLQGLIQESDIVVQQLEEDLSVYQSMIEAAEHTQTAYKAIEQWAQAFCNRDGETIVELASDKVEQDLEHRDLLLHGVDSGKDYIAFGWSSPWPWGGNFGEDITANNYRVVNVTDHNAEILYYAWVSNPHITVWQELLTFEIDNDVCIVTSEELHFMEGICIAEEFQRAYPDGITNTMMDYVSFNGAGETLNAHAVKNQNDSWYGRMLKPDSAAVILLNILDNPNKVGVHVTKSDTEENVCTVIFEFYEDGSTVSVQMIQPYGSDGIWVPYTGDFSAADATTATTNQITDQNVDDVIAADNRQLEALFSNHHEFAFDSEFPQFADLNGDGIEEKIEMVDLRYNGGDGGYALKVTDTKTGKQIPLPDGYTQESGFPVFATFFPKFTTEKGVEPALLIQLGEEKRCSIIAVITQDALLRIYERNNHLEQVRDSIENHLDDVILADALSGCNLVIYDGEETPTLLLKTYISGFAGHADTLGYLITKLKLEKDNTWIVSHYFLLDSCDDALMMQNPQNADESGVWTLPFETQTSINIIQLTPEE